MSAPFLDRVVLVTGAGQPLADAVARLFTARGARVALVFLEDDAEAAVAFAAELPAISCQACDPADPKSVKSAVRQVVERAGRLDVVVNAVTCRADGPISDLDDAVWKRVLDVELGGTVYFCREAIRPMLRQRSGAIVNLTDVAGLRGEAGAANHASARGGVAAFTRALASELAPLGVRVNAIATGLLEGELDRVPEARRDRIKAATPLGRGVRPEEVAEAVLFLASSASSFTTGHILQVNGGLYL